jgi:hypothetical protein
MALKKIKWIGNCSKKKQVKPKLNSNPSSLKGIDTHAKQSAEKLWDIMLVADIYGEGNHPKIHKKLGKQGYYKNNVGDYQSAFSWHWTNW